MKLIVFVFAFMTVAFAKPTSPLSPECSSKCPVCPKTPTCPPGVSLVPDKCGCCKKCARQLNEPCDADNKCDVHKNHYCNYAEFDDLTGICLAKPGRACYINGETVLSGHSFAPSCKVSCLCVDGDIGCVPQCPTKLAVPKNCSHPRLVRKPNKCCEEWVCESSIKNTHHERPRFDLTFESAPRYVPPYSQRRNYSPFGLAAVRASPIEVTMRVKDGCKVQTTSWSACSKSCGWGVSERVSNDNAACKFKKQSRLCQIRPCENSFLEHIKKGKKCIRTPRANKPVQYTFSGCKSKIYKPKYCGGCTDGRCCVPSKTKTVGVKFTCDNGSTFKKRLMVIKSCKCMRDCPSQNDIFSYRRNIGSDTWQS